MLMGDTIGSVDIICVCVCVWERERERAIIVITVKGHIVCVLLANGLAYLKKKKKFSNRANLPLLLPVL